MASVTQRIQSIKQPYGGYIRPSKFETKLFDDGFTLNDKENVHYSCIGMAVDYLTRFLTGTNLKDAFIISLYGAYYAEHFGKKESLKAAIMLLKGIKDLIMNLLAML